MSLQRCNVQCDFGGYWNYQNAPFQFGVPSNAPQTDAAILGGGLSATPLVLTPGAAAQKAISFVVTNNSTVDSNRAAYFKQYLTGAGGGGEAVRAYNVFSGASSAGTTLSGLNATMEFLAAGVATGTIAGVVANFTADAATKTLGGQVACLCCQSNLATGITVGADTAFIMCTDEGAVPIQNLFNLYGVSAGVYTAGNTMFLSTVNSTTISQKLKISINGATYYIALCSAA